MIRGLSALMRDESGATAIEYALIGGFIAVAAVAGLEVLGDAWAGTFLNVSSTVDGVVQKVAGN